MYLLFILGIFINLLWCCSLGKFFGFRGLIYLLSFIVIKSLVLIFLILWEFSLCNNYVIIVELGIWFKIGLFNSTWSFRFDNLVVWMSFLIVFILCFVFFFSINYMFFDPNLGRFLCYLVFFKFFMLLLVCSDNFIQMFLGWEGVGLFSYLLINFWFARNEANRAAMKAFLINKIGDLFILISIIFMFIIFNSFRYSIIFSSIYYSFNDVFYIFNFLFYKIDIICFFLLVGCISKSAQIGMHMWLPAAMEGPTPVSALLHAATMVTAGVYLILRCSFLFQYSDFCLFLIIFIGLLTTIFGGLVALYQNDLKKIIACSTLSQIGYMFYSCGLLNFDISFFHLLCHGFFKALLFLSVGFIINGLLNYQDMRFMGGLSKFYSFIYICFIFGSLSLMGLPFFSGYYSKDFLLEVSYSKYEFFSSLSFVLGSISAIITIMYSLKFIYIVFFFKSLSSLSVLKNKTILTLNLKLVFFFLLVFSVWFGFFFKDFFLGLGNINFNFFFYNFIFYRFLEVEFFNLNYKFLSFFFFFLLLVFFFFFFKRFSRWRIKKKKYRNLVRFFNQFWYFDLISSYLIEFFFKISFEIFYKKIDKGGLEYLSVFFFKNVVLSCLNLFRMEVNNQQLFLYFVVFFIFFFFFGLILPFFFFEFIYLILFFDYKSYKLLDYIYIFENIYNYCEISIIVLFLIRINIVDFKILLEKKKINLKKKKVNLKNDVMKDKILNDFKFLLEKKCNNYKLNRKKKYIILDILYNFFSKLNFKNKVVDIYIYYNLKIKYGYLYFFSNKDVLKMQQNKIINLKKNIWFFFKVFKR